MPEAALTSGLKTAIREADPQYVVISGDFVNKAHPKTFATASTYVRELLQAAGIDIPGKLLIVPGNHDVSFFPKAVEDNLVRLKLFRQFAKRVFQADDIEDRRQHFVRLDRERQVLFLGLDTTLKTSFPLAEGEVGEPQLRWAAAKLSELRQSLGSNFDNFAKILIIHHHSHSIAGTPAKSERMMSLLDAGSLLKLINEYRFNIVLHGHKHVPRVDIFLNSDSTPLIVAGAGTATCPYPEDQNTFGNNFNLIEITPSYNRVRIQRQKANQSGVFSPDGLAETFPLFKANLHGFRIRRLRKIVTIGPTGDTHVVFDRQGLSVETGRSMATLPIRVAAQTHGAKIGNFRALRMPPATTVNFFSEGEKIYDGEWRFKHPLHDASEVDLTYEYDIEASTMMSIEELQRRLPLQDPGETFESTGVTIIGAINTLEISVRFPQRYTPLNIAAYKTHLGVPERLDRGKLLADPVLNEWTFCINNPDADTSIDLQWDLPQTWTP